MSRLILAAIMAIALLSTGEAVAGSVSVEHVWSRATPKGAVTGVIYLTIVNRGDSEDRIVGASSPVAATVQFHTSSNENGVMKMNQLQALDMPAGSSLVLKPGSTHMMLTRMKRQLKEGENFPLTLTFEKAGPIEASVRVGKVGAMVDPSGVTNSGG